MSEAYINCKVTRTFHPVGQCLGTFQLPHHGSHSDCDVEQLQSLFARLREARNDSVWWQIRHPDMLNKSFTFAVAAFGGKNTYGHPASDLVNCATINGSSVPVLVSEREASKLVQTFEMSLFTRNGATHLIKNLQLL